MLCVLFICVLCEKKYVILYLSLCHSVLQKSPVSLPHSVILSSKNICLTLSLCHYVFKKNICLLPSLCYSVLQKSPVSLRPSVILSSKKHLSHSVPLLFCLQDHPFCLSCPHVTLSSKLPCLPLSLGHYVGRQRIQNLDKTVQKNRKEGVSIMTHPLLLCYYLEEEISSQRPFYFFLPFVMYFIATFISLAITFASRWKSSLSFPCK